MSTTETSKPTIPAGWHVSFRGDGMNDTLRDQLIVAMKKVFDPEIPVDVYELGLIYDVDVTADNFANVLMTLTSPNCPSAEQIPVDVDKRIREIESMKDVKVVVTFDPAWTKEKMSETALLELGMDL